MSILLVDRMWPRHQTPPRLSAELDPPASVDSRNHRPLEGPSQARLDEITAQLSAAEAGRGAFGQRERDVPVSAEPPELGPRRARTWADLVAARAAQEEALRHPMEQAAEEVAVPAQAPVSVPTGRGRFADLEASRAFPTEAHRQPRSGRGAHGSNLPHDLRSGPGSSRRIIDEVLVTHPAAAPHSVRPPFPPAVSRLHPRRSPRQRGNGRRGSTTSPSSPAAVTARSTIPVPPPHPASLQHLAEEASTLLELFSRSSLASDDDDISAEHQALVANAAAGIAAIQARFRQSAARKNGDIAALPRPSDARAGADCVICFTERADRLFMPCKHLVACSVSI